MIEPDVPGDMLRKLVESKGGKLCERCKCCEMLWQEDSECGGSGHYDRVGDDDGVLYQDGVEQCSTCGGTGGWWTCTCDDKGEHNESWKDNR
jgi:hypothetical protein